MTFSTSRGRGLLLQRLAEIVGALAQLVEQPRVLDGDDGLGGEVLHQLDLLVGEGPDLLAIDDDSADQLVVLEHRHGEQRARAAEFDDGSDRWIAFEIGWLSVMIGDMDQRLRLRDRLTPAPYSGCG